MCGIAGFSGKKNEQILKQMLDSIKHRGPDGEGVFAGDHFSIGMRRLAIIDPNTGWQPIWNEDKSVAIVFNGEIYNYQVLWKELEARGHKFKTDHSDTETVVHGYEEWGEKVLEKLQGMFAFAIYDLRKKQLFIARDRLGIKPLYYTTAAGRIIFASEIKALLTFPGVKPELNRSVLYEYLKFRTHDHREDTFFQGIKRLLPAHYMLLDASGKITKNEQYWEPAINLEFSGNKSDADYASELRQIFTDTIRLHLISDVPVGISLSGGLDSSGVASIVADLIKHGEDLHTQKMLTFSAVYPGDPIDESRFISDVVKWTGAEEHYVTPTVDNFWNEIDDWIYTQEEPTISSAPYAGYCVMREAHNYVKVMLSGQGGDELFAGYIPYFASYVKSALKQKKIPQVLREFIQGYDLYSGYVGGMIKAKINRSDHITLSELINSNAFPEKSFHYLLEDNLNRRLFNDVREFSVPNILRYEDKNAMAFSIETRVPFLDHKFVEFALGLPLDQKIKHGWNRYVYRNAMKGIIPDSIRLRRKKIGFTTPEVRWLKQKADLVADIFASAEVKQLDFINQSSLTKAFQDWTSAERNGDAMLFWRLLNTILWLKRFSISIH